MQNSLNQPLDLEQKIVEEAKKALKETNKLIRYCVSDAILSNVSMSEMNRMAIFLSDYVDYIIKKIADGEENG